MIDFNYKVEPQFGKFPFGFGPMSLLKDTKMNWYAKKGFAWVYWNMLLPGRHLGEFQLSFKGKDIAA